MPIFKIAIIGGGASAALIAAHLAQNAASGSFQLDIYDRGGNFARGMAYATNRDCHLLNVRARDMSALAQDPQHFVRWAEDFGIASSDFAPRRLYGDYLESVLQSAAQTLPINIIKQDILACIKTKDSYTLKLETGDQNYDFVVLASGNVRALGPRFETLDIPGYFPDPWHLDDTALKSAGSVALIGSGLTAVDALLSLHDIGFQGNVTIISRHGLLPRTHAAPQTWEQNQGLLLGLSPLQLLQQLRAQAAEAQNQNIPWQAVMDSLRPVTNQLWAGFSPPQRAGFMRHLYTLWGVHRHRMAPDVARIAEDYSAQKRLSFYKARVRELHSHKGRPILSLDDGAQLSFDAAINCMGYRYDEPGKSFDVSAKIGPARFGDLFETTAIPEIRAQAHEIAATILQTKP